nr:hypothetical protein Iba_chr10dCG10800 [Ipomoea batatas]
MFTASSTTAEIVELLTVHGTCALGLKPVELLTVTGTCALELRTTEFLTGSTIAFGTDLGTVSWKEGLASIFSVASFVGETLEHGTEFDAVDCQRPSFPTSATCSSSTIDSTFGFIAFILTNSGLGHNFRSAVDSGAIQRWFAVGTPRPKSGAIRVGLLCCNLSLATALDICFFTLMHNVSLNTFPPYETGSPKRCEVEMTEL